MFPTSLSGRLPIKDQAPRRHTYTVQAFGHDPTKRQVLGPVVTEDPLVVLEL